MSDKGNGLQVSLSNPHKGWIELAVSTTEEEVKQVVSYTPNDFVLELATALSLLMQGADGVAVASCEPITYELTFLNMTAPFVTQLQIVKHPDWNRNRRLGSVILSFQATRLGIVLPFWRALRDLEGRCSGAEYREAMRKDFPSACMQRLSQLVSDQRG
jgi:hypothetical protein